MGWLADINPAWLALAGAVFGGVGLEVVRKWLSRAQEKDETQTQYRKEIRSDLDSCRVDLRRVQEDLDAQRERYYRMLEEFIAVKTQMDSALRQLQKAGLIEEIPPSPTLRDILEKELST